MKKAFAMAMVFLLSLGSGTVAFANNGQEIGRASCRERV